MEVVLEWGRKGRRDGSEFTLGSSGKMNRAVMISRNPASSGGEW